MVKAIFNNSKNAQTILLSAVIVLIQYYVLFDPSDLCFFDDWCDNLYLISQTAHSIRKTGQFPILLNAEVVGSNVYQLYGYTFYSYLGIISLFFSSVNVLKFHILFFQFIKVYLLAALAGKSFDFKTSIAIAFILSWSTYNASVYFSAGSLPSVIGSEFITLGMLFFVLYYYKNSIFSLYGGTILCLTGMLCWPGHIFHGIIILSPFIFLQFRSIRLRDYLIIITLSMIICTPYFIELYKFAKNTPNFEVGLGWFDYLDTLRNRINPYPFNSLNSKKGLIPFDTPYNDTQINIYAPLLTVWLYLFEYKKLSTISVIYFVLGFMYLTFSVSQEITNIIPSFLTHLHFSYRYIHYVELCFLIAFSFQLLNLFPNKSRSVTIVYFLLGMVVVSVLIRGDHSTFARGHVPFDNWGGGDFVGKMGYKSNQEAVKEMFSAELFETSEKKDQLLETIPRSAAQTWSYGDVTEKRFSLNPCNAPKLTTSPINYVTLDADCILKVPVFPFSGNVLSIDGKHLEDKYITVNSDKLYMDILITKGSHSISYKLYEPYVKQRLTSAILLMFVLLLFIAEIITTSLILKGELFK